MTTTSAAEETKTNITMYDSASGAWPLRGNGAGAVLLVYVDSWGGWWKGVHYQSNFLLAKAKFPSAWLVQISVEFPGQPGVAAYDCELGALTPEEVCAQANTELVKKQRVPTFYGGGYTLTQIEGVLKSDYPRWQVGRDIDYLMANPDNNPTIPPGCIGKQYVWNYPWQCDTSVVIPTWSALKPR